jgi:ABC-type thiamine transport system ATPase subunit
VTSVSIRDLTLKFGSLEVLKSLNLDIDEGEFLVLLGPSGCGKSTLLNCIAGLLDISDGQIFIGGNNVTWSEPSERGIGMVFQSYALYPQMTVEGNLAFGLKNARMPKDQIAERIARAAEVLQIEPLLKRKPALRWSAPAGRHRPGAGARCRRVPVRRAVVQSRCQVACRIACRDQAAASPAPEHHDLRHPRPDRGTDAGRPHRHHAQRHHPAA